MAHDFSSTGCGRLWSTLELRLGLLRSVRYILVLFKSQTFAYNSFALGLSESLLAAPPTVANIPGRPTIAQTSIERVNRDDSGTRNQESNRGGGNSSRASPPRDVDRNYSRRRARSRSRSPAQARSRSRSRSQIRHRSPIRERRYRARSRSRSRSRSPHNRYSSRKRSSSRSPDRSRRDHRSSSPRPRRRSPNTSPRRTPPSRTSQNDRIGKESAPTATSSNPANLPYDPETSAPQTVRLVPIKIEPESRLLQHAFANVAKGTLLPCKEK